MWNKIIDQRIPEPWEQRGQMSLGAEVPPPDGPLTSNVTHTPLRMVPLFTSCLQMNPSGPSETQVKIIGERTAVGVGNGLGTATQDLVKVRKTSLITSRGCWQGLLEKTGIHQWKNGVAIADKQRMLPHQALTSQPPQQCTLGGLRMGMHRVLAPEGCCCCCSVAQLCLTLCHPMDCSTPGVPVHHHLPEFAQTYVHWVSDAIQPSHPLLSPSPPDLNLSQHQGLFQWVSSSHQVTKVLALQPQHQSLQQGFRTDFLQDGLVWSPWSPESWDVC